MCPKLNKTFSIFLVKHPKMKRKLESIMDCSDKFDRQITIFGEKSDPELVSIHKNSSVTASKFSVLVSYFKSHFDKIMHDQPRNRN